ncbi:MAG: hypothetical protein JNM24_14620 [Bdellovibrionaceae bacterium]|nr:hypothetical protein [Pseudobdellovibrionaceae bacterium]
MIKQIFGVLFFTFLVSGQTPKKKIPSISYQNILNCYPDLENEKIEFDVDLNVLKKNIDQKYPTSKSTLRYRRVLYTDPKLGTNPHRLTISLQKWAKGVPHYDFYLEKLDKDSVAEIVPVQKEKFKNIVKDVPQAYLLDVKLLEDESLWLDTKPNKTEMSYKTSNDSVLELDLSQGSGKVQLKCESKKSQGVLCLCLKR